MKGLSGTDLLWMIRQEDNFLVLILYHEVLEVLPSSFTLKVAETQERLVHVVRPAEVFFLRFDHFFEMFLTRRLNYTMSAFLRYI